MPPRSKRSPKGRRSTLPLHLLMLRTRMTKDQEGATAIEYALIASLISVAAIAGFHSLGGKVESSYADIEENLDNHL